MKKLYTILTATLVFIALAVLAQIQPIGIGNAPNDGTGDTLRTAFGKANTNFSYLTNYLAGVPKLNSVNYFSASNAFSGPTIFSNIVYIADSSADTPYVSLIHETDNFAIVHEGLSIAFRADLMELEVTGGIRSSGAVTGTYFVSENPTVPATAGDAGTPGQIAWDANYLYVCVAANTWKRIALSSW